MRSPFLEHGFTITGLNLERFLNTLQKEGVGLVSVRRVDYRTLDCRCKSADLERIASIVQEKGWRMEEVHPVGACAWLRRLFSRPGLLIGAALGIALLLIASRFVWLIRLEGAGAYQADIAAYLAQEGYRAGMSKTQVDAPTLALLLQRRYPKVAWFRVYVRNVTLVVECTQGEPAPPLPGTEPADLTAARDGVIESLQVYAGTAAVRPGDLVRKGQVLIRGVERSKDGEEVPVCARGQVLARCWTELTVQVPLQEILTRETGRVTRRESLCTPWLCWPPQEELPQYLTYQLQITETPVVGCFFPCWQRVTEYREVALEYGQRPEAEALEEAKAAASARLKQTLRGYQLEDSWLSSEISPEGYACATASGEWLTDLCREDEHLP